MGRVVETAQNCGPFCNGMGLCDNSSTTDLLGQFAQLQKKGPVLVLLYPSVQFINLDKVVQKLIPDHARIALKDVILASFSKIYQDKDCVRTFGFCPV